MTSAAAKWQEWMDANWPNAEDRWRRKLWAFWCDAIAVGRELKAEGSPGSPDERLVYAKGRESMRLEFAAALDCDPDDALAVAQRRTETG